MPAYSQVARWGNSLAIRIPGDLLKDAGVEEGDRFSLDVAEDGAIVIRSTRRKYSLEELVSAITRKNLHGEIDFGRHLRGKEVW